MTGRRSDGARPEGWVVGGCPVLIERTAQLDFLERAATQTAAGEAQLVVLTGEAGAGKSRLAREFTASLGGEWRTSFVRIETGSTDPFGGVIGTVPAGDAPAGAIGSALGRALASRAADGPLAIVIEDLERSDPVMIAALASALDVLATDPVLLLAAFRLGGAPQSREVTSALARVLRHGRAHEVRVQSLSRAGVAEMAVAMGHELRDADLDALHARGGGNPFFVEELLQAPAERLPWTITEAVLERLDALPAPARDVARALACAQDPLPRAVIEEIVPEAASGTRLLLDTGIARVASGEDISLRHALTAEIVETQLSAKDRHAWHRRLAEVLELRQDAPPARLTRHWHAAGDRERAARWAVVAADEATKGRAYRTAAELYRIALESPPPDAMDEAELFDRAAVAAGWAGLQRDAIEWATEADLRYRRAGEQWRAVALWMSPAFTHAPKPPVDHRELAEDAIPRLLVEAHEATRRGELDRSVELARRVLDLSDDRSDLGAAWTADAARRLISAGRLAEGEDILHRLRAAASASQDYVHLARTMGGLATLAAARGELADCLTINRQAIAAARKTDLGSWPYEVGTALVLAYLAELDEASALVARVQDLGDAVATEFSQLPACLIDLERGDLDTAWERLERLQVVHSLGVADFTVGVLAARARWYVLTGDHEGALDTVTQASAVTGDLFEPSRVEILVLGVRAAAELGDDARVAAACTALDAAVELGGGRGLRAAATWARGLARARAGALDDAMSLLSSGAEHFEAAHRFTYAAEAWADLARVAHERGDVATRDRAVERASEIARERHLRSVQLRVEAQAAGNLVAPEGALGPLRSLSTREREIARLVVEGKTNREIASVLFISEHTVRNQLVHIFAKLGISRRTELARLAAGLTPPAE